MRLRERSVLGLALLLVAANPVQAAEPAAWADTLAVPDQTTTHMSAFESGDAFVYMHNRGSVYKSIDHGVNWLPIPTAPASNGIFEMATPMRGFFASHESLFRTDNGALLWDKLPPVELPGRHWNPSRKDFRGYHYSLEAVAPPGNGERVAFGGNFGYISKKERESAQTECFGGRYSAAVFTANDGGRSGDYRITKLGFPGHVTRMGWLNPKVGWALAYDMRRDGPSVCDSSSSFRNVVLITRDGGRSYEEVHSCEGDPIEGQEGDGYCTAVAMPDANTVVIGKTNGWVYMSNNRGYGFEPMQQLSPPGFDQTYTHWVSGIEFANAEVGYAVAKGGGTWRTDNGGEGWSFEPSSQVVWGIGIGDIAVADAEHAIAGGPNSIITRVPAPGDAREAAAPIQNAFASDRLADSHRLVIQSSGQMHVPPMTALVSVSRRGGQ